MVKNLPYFKIGDTLNIPVVWTDENDVAIEIPSGAEIACTILTSYGVRFFPDVIIDPDQVNNTGQFTISLSPETTETFIPCTATLDIRMTFDGVVKHSQDFSFIVKRSITIEHTV